VENDRFELPPADLVSIHDAAIFADIHKVTLWRMIARGEVRAWGRRNYFRVSISELLPQVKPHPFGPIPKGFVDHPPSSRKVGTSGD
jgi:hypothetical protein